MGNKKKELLVVSMLNDQTTDEIIADILKMPM